MEYEKIANLLGDASNKTSKFKTRKWIEININITYSIEYMILQEQTILAVKSNLKLLC